MTAWILAALAVAASPADGGACAAATADVAFGKRMLPTDLAARVEAYRWRWGAFCGRAGGSLAPLFEEALRVERAFLPVLDRWRPETSEAKAVARAESFLPAFRGGVDLVSSRSRSLLYLDVDRAEFARQAERGTAEDRAFFGAYGRLAGDPAQPPWIASVADPALPGCLDLSRYDWAASFQEVARLEARLTARIYRDALRGLARAWAAELSAVGAGKPVCVCGTRADAVAALGRAVASLERRAGAGRGRESARNALPAVANGGSATRWECGGRVSASRGPR